MIECIVTSSVLIAVVIALRFLFRGRISRRLQYALWGLVLIRLLMPFPLFGSPLSVMNAVDTARITDSISGIRVYSDMIRDTEMSPEQARAAGRGTLHEIQGPSAESGGGHLRSYIFTDSLDVVLARIFKIVWLAGGILAGLWFAGTNLVFYRRLRKARRSYDAAGCRLPVYVADRLASPCLFGLFRPAVYLTPKAAENEGGARHVLAHELCHYRHGDHIWSILRGLCLALWWWNPLVWAAAVLSRADSELACDEAVLKRIGAENRFVYGRTLVDMIAVREGPSGIMNAATMMVSGKRGIKERLNMIVRNPKTVVPALAAVLLAIAVCVGCTFTGARIASLSAEEALLELAASAYHTENEVSFRIPEDYEKPEEWNIHIAGRLAYDDGFSQSIHHLEDINDAGAWEPGRTYTIPLNDAYTELKLTAYLPGKDGKALEETVDLLNTPPFTVSYGLIKYTDGEAQLSRSPLNGDGARLAGDIVMDYMVKSSAWPGVDISALDECFQLRATYPDGTAIDYYAFLLDGKAVMQMGKDGRYSRIDDGLYEKLAELARNSISTIGGADGPTDIAITKSVDRTDLDACITDAILSANADYYSGGDFAAEAHTELKTVRSGGKVTFYAMALYMEFGYDADGGFSDTGGSYMPVAITFEKNAAGEYGLIEYWMPRDGGDAASIREKFPSDIHEDALDTRNYITAHVQSCYAKAIEYGRVDTGAIIKELVDTICSSPAQMSNPGAYIDAHPTEYRKMLYCGNYTLRYCFSLFEQGGQTGLDGHIMASACRDILGGEDISALADTGQDWYGAFKANAENLRRQNGDDYMEKNMPGSWFLLRMLDESKK